MSNSHPIRVLLIDDEHLFLEITSEALSDLGCEVDTADSWEKAQEKLESRFFEVVVLDLRMPEMDGLQMLRTIKKERPTQQVVMLTGHGSIPDAIEAMKIGAFGFFFQTHKTDDLLLAINRAAERGRLERRNIALEEELERTKGSGEIIGKSRGIQQVYDFIEKAALSDLPVLITGESGTGKELVARAIHRRSDRSSNSLVVVDGSTLREELFASELFGHEKGAFTGAVKKKAGLFEVADRGAIFLDEIGELSSANQAALLRVIEYGTFRPVGSIREIKTDVRVIAATNKLIEAAVQRGEFRQDLFYRLNGLAINILPLRERVEDIEPLSEYFLNLWNTKTGEEIRLSRQALSILQSYSWPGNVRQLRYVIELAALSALKEGEIKDSHIRPEVTDPVIQVPDPEFDGIAQSSDQDKNPWTIRFPTDDLSLTEFRNHCEREYISRLLDKFEGNKTQIAKAMGISRSKIYEKLRTFRLE